MSQLAIVIDNPDYPATAFTGTEFLAIAEDVVRQVRRALPVGEHVTLDSVAVATDIVVNPSGTFAPTAAPDTVAGSNGVLLSALTWVKSTDASVIAQLVELVANSDGVTVLASQYVGPSTQSLTLVTTAVAQKARVTAINEAGTSVSALSSTITPTVIDPPDTVAGTNGILSTDLTWVKSTTVTAVAQKIEFLADSDASVLKTYYVAAADQSGTFVATAVAQKARVTAITTQGSSAVSALSATFTPTAS